MKNFSLLICAFLFSFNLTAQDFTLSGVITDGETDEPIIGASLLSGDNGVVTDFDGKYTMRLSNGDHSISISYVGYDDQVVEVSINGADQNLDIKLSSGVLLEEITVVADIARERETPVAFSNIPTKKLDEELAAQDLPMILNSTPGAYATQSGGGDGDARITIRGFNQRNVAVMLDGIPVNDMENGWVFWSNWFGLDLVTKTMQVQRGLGASKLAIPSVGGTINILTKGIESKKAVKIRQEVGNNGYLRTTVGLTSGRLKNGWGISAAGSYKQGDGWVNHGQRSFKAPISSWDAGYANGEGISQEVIDAAIYADKGLRFNQHWGTLNGEKINTRKNFYHKPQFSLRHSYNRGSKFFLSNVAYLSIGSGGGTGTYGSFDRDSTDQLDLTKAYEANIFTSPLFKPEPYSENIIRASINNHFWYGLLSTARYNVNDNWTLSGGVDLRDYEGEHTREVYDLLGGDYFRSERNARIDQANTKLYEGDRYFYHDKGFVRWAGLFGLVEYKNERLSGFLNLSTAQTGYKAEDYMFHKELKIGDESHLISYEDPLELDGTLYTVDNPSQEDIDYATDNNLVLDTKSAKNQLIDWVWIPSFTFKTGASYKINKQNSVFVNTGYLSKATRFNNVNDSRFSGDVGRLVQFENFKNEEIYAFELGYSFKSSLLQLFHSTLLTLSQKEFR